MQKLVLLYWGTVFLMYLSEVYYPCDKRALGSQTGKRHFLRRKSDVFMVIVIAWMTCFSFLRTGYNDTVNYITDFLYMSKPVDHFWAESDLLKIGGNGLFVLYQNVIYHFTKEYHIFFFFPALLNTIAIIKVYKRFSVNPAFSLLLFFSVGTYVMYIAAMKQSIAVAILLIALPYAIDKKYVRFYILTFIAMLFHTHAFVFLVVPFFFGKPWGKVTWILLMAVVFSMATYDMTFGTFMNVALDMGINIVDWELFDGHSINPLRVMVYWIPAILALLFREHLFNDSNRTENLFANLSIGAALILTIGLREGANLFARMAAYYEFAMAIALPWMVKKLFMKQSANFVMITATILYFGYFLYEHAISKSFGSTYSAISLWQFISGFFS